MLESCGQRTSLHLDSGACRQKKSGEVGMTTPGIHIGSTYNERVSMLVSCISIESRIVSKLSMVGILTC